MEPQWPFAYSKFHNEQYESKGRVNSNIQDMRHKCATAGVQSKCHICERIRCGDYVGDSNATQLWDQKSGWDDAAPNKTTQGRVTDSRLDHYCEYQIQGVEWKELAKNVPTVSDTPWAVGGAHRNDFGNATHMCVMLSGGHCITPNSHDYSNCTVRCWGHNQAGEIKERSHRGKLDASKLPRNNPHTTQGEDPWPHRGDYGAADSWEREKTTHNAQGFVGTLAGTGVAGYRDGNQSYAQFNNPQDVAVDAQRNVYVADTLNHAIRKVSPDGTVETVAGIGGQAGFADGPADQATFSRPSGITVYYDWRDSFLYMGCYPRDTTFTLNVSDYKMNPSFCWRKCWNSAYFAVQRGTECWCSDAPPNPPSVPAATCSEPCNSYAGTPEDPPWGSRAWGPSSVPVAGIYPPPGPLVKWLRTDQGKCGGHGTSSVYQNKKGTGELVLFVADTGNHRIRMIKNGQVTCYAGRCGNGTFSATASKYQALPQPGFADGTGDVARFHTPMGVAVDRNGTLFVADAGNYLVRYVYYEGVVHTLAGNLDIAEKTETGDKRPGCPEPCLKGIPGTRDGNLTHAQFMHPSDVTIGLNDTVVVTDNHKIRQVTYSRYAMIAQSGDGHLNMYTVFPQQSQIGSEPGTSTVQGVESQDRVVTLAGHDVSGRTDGEGNKWHDGKETAGWASFNRAEGITMDAAGRIYVVESGSCRIRRMSSAMHTAVNTTTCLTTAPQLLRPSGCASYNPPVDSLDFTASPANGNIYWRYDERAARGKLSEYDLYGRHVYNCQGTPPADGLMKGPLEIDMWDRRIYEESQFPENYRILPLNGSITDIKEDTADGTQIHILCPPGCNTQDAPVWGTDLYADYSSVCYAAIHQGAVSANGGLVTVTLRRGSESRNSTSRAGTVRYGIQSKSIPYEVERVFSVEHYYLATIEVQTISGYPTSILEHNEHGCGFADARPPQEARFNKPTGISIFVNASLTDTEYIYIADTLNNRIRKMSAVCSKICENGGECVSADECLCPVGWGGDDCTLPVCSTPCGSRKLCVAPDTCDCIPGYKGANCLEALCVQNCYHGGYCGAPDTCTCLPGWFDSNCTTPVCTQTCAHGGNCTGPNICTCPSDWTGVDCRIPVCEQAEWNGHDGKLLLQAPGLNTPSNTSRFGVRPVYRCRNGGYCAAPNTCLCPPQWSGHDCGLPVCSQGFMVPDTQSPVNVLGQWGYPHLTSFQRKNSMVIETRLRPKRWPQYTPCRLDKWVETTGDFDFAQRDREAVASVVEGGGNWRAITGWNKTQPRCFLMELGEDSVSPYQYFDEYNRTTEYARFTPKTPYGPNADGHPWEAWTSPTFGRTQPWAYERDRQLALVEWRNVTQGAYVCANSGNCTAPDTCECAHGWIGFDCRTPVCEQGYYEPTQLEMTMPDRFSIRGEQFTSPHARQPDSNPAYTMEDVNITQTDVIKELRTYGDIRYLAEGAVSGIRQKWTGQSGLQEILDRLDLDRNKMIAGNDDSGDRKIDRPELPAGTKFQGGYSCSIRSLTHWEKPRTIGPRLREGTCYGWNTSCNQASRAFEHPNYYSRYMNKEMQADYLYYTHWVGMEWPPLYQKCARSSKANLAMNPKRPEFECLFPLLDEASEGQKRDGIWRRTTQLWAKGICLMEFNRTCKTAPWKAMDLETKLANVLVVDTDKSFRQRVTYNYSKATSSGRWMQAGGECVDEVIRGCYNNGTCIGPNKCRCAPGWTGFDCSIPMCTQNCQHNGNCTLPDTCTCEKGWTGYACEVPMCAQDCNNGGVCIAPDMCKCRIWPSKFYDGREAGGRPIYRKPNGESQDTGWTGYDCSTPICVQHDKWMLNVKQFSQGANPWYPLWGRAKRDIGCGFDMDGMASCTLPNSLNSIEILEWLPIYTEGIYEHTGIPGKCYEKVLPTDCPRAPYVQGNCAEKPFCDEYDQPVVTNDGRSFQSGCSVSTTGTGDKSQVWPRANPDCTDNKNLTILRLRDYDDANNINRTHASLCDIKVWIQGDYLDDGNSPVLPHGWHKTLNHDQPVQKNLKWFGQPYNSTLWLSNEDPWRDYEELGAPGRHVRPNHHDYQYNPDGTVSEVLPPRRGEGIYSCHNRGSCIFPDRCTCADGWAGFDCQTPLCRHKQTDPFLGDMNIASCLNGGVCSWKDNCTCIQTESILHKSFIDAPVGLTGWMSQFELPVEKSCRRTSADGKCIATTTDCSIAKCVQGFYDPTCYGISPAGQGCYRCNNGGNCTAPDHCTCAEGWTGYDCMTPVCTQVATIQSRLDLNTVDEDRVHEFEMDPCGMNGGRWGMVDWKGLSVGQGNCTMPNTCTCLCKVPFMGERCEKYETQCLRAWKDPLDRSIPPGFTFGGLTRGSKFRTDECYSGFEGNVNMGQQFTSCHLQIYVPTWWERDSIILIAVSGVLFFFGTIGYIVLRKKLRQRFLLAKVLYSLFDEYCMHIVCSRFISSGRETPFKKEQREQPDRSEVGGIWASIVLECPNAGRRVGLLNTPICSAFPDVCRGEHCTHAHWHVIERRAPTCTHMCITRAHLDGTSWDHHVTIFAFVLISKLN
jgi:hypothetical protein